LHEKEIQLYFTWAIIFVVPIVYIADTLYF
jgi:hypothetical protein